jgi:Na+/H+-dicarboxylate symporter
MKIWLKVYAGGVLGIILGIFLSGAAGESAGILPWLSGLAIRFGRYAVLPLVLFSMIISVYELRLERKLLRIHLNVLVYAVLTSIGVITLGVIAVSFFSPGRIPVIMETQLPLKAPDAKELLYRVFPENIFSIFTDSGDFLLPLTVFGLFFGLCLTHDRRSLRLLVEQADSLARVFYQLNSFITELIFICCAVLAASLTVQLKAVADLDQFLGLFLLTGILSLALLFIVFPLILYLRRGRKRPYRWLYAQLGPALAAFLSGDLYFSLGLLIRHSREALGVPRRVYSVACPLLAVFSRGGSAMVTAVSFITVLKSYSSLEIGFSQFAWIIIMSFGISLLLGAVPGMGALVGIATLSSFYGKGMEEAFLILRPAAVCLIGIGALLDTVCASFVTLLVSDKMRLTGDEKGFTLP